MKKILHFEDEELLGQMYGAKLAQEGFDYKWYLQPPSNHSELVNLVLKEKPDLIIMDTIMPKMDGFEATKVIKNDSRTKDIPLVFLSNYGQDEATKQGLSLGAVDYLISANFRPEELVDKIRLLLVGYSKK